MFSENQSSGWAFVEKLAFMWSITVLVCYPEYFGQGMFWYFLGHSSF